MLLYVDNLHYEKFADGTVKEVEVPFEIPDSWEWTRLSSLSSKIHYGYTASAQEKGNSKLLRITDIQNNSVDWSTVPYCDISEDKLENMKLVDYDILIARTGGTIGKSFQIKNVSDIAVFASYLIRVQSVISKISVFVKRFIESPNYWLQLQEMSMGTGQPNVNATNLSTLLIPIAPIKEQQRILDRIELINKDVTVYTDSYSKLEKLNKNFPEKLRKSILQYAMQGKLVPQDPNDEPVEVLLEKIRAEKQKLFEEGKLKKKDLEESIIYKGDDNSYYEKKGKMTNKIDVPINLPTNWKWSRLSQIGALIRGSGIKKSETTSEGIGCVRYGELYTTYGFYFTSTKSFTTEKVAKKSKEISYSDVLMTLTGENKEDIGKATVYLGEEKIVMGGDLTKLTAHKMNPLFLSLLLNSPMIISQKSTVATGNIIVHISNEKLSKMLVPVPPLTEQSKIVNQVEKLNLQLSQLSQ